MQTGTIVKSSVEIKSDDGTPIIPVGTIGIVCARSKTDSESTERTPCQPPVKAKPLSWRLDEIEELITEFEEINGFKSPDEACLVVSFECNGQRWNLDVHPDEIVKFSDPDEQVAWVKSWVQLPQGI